MSAALPAHPSHLPAHIDCHLGRTYTAVTPEVLLAIGAHKVPYAYDAARAASVAKSALTENEPMDHPYGVAEQAYRLAIRQQCKQLIVLTGESGSGKTRNASLIIDFLARKNAEDATSARLSTMLAHANTLLSAFGCADLGPSAAQASRFERETCIRFAADGRATCASVGIFGLEEWRIARRPDNERNFAIFYQLLAGARVWQLRELHLITDRGNGASSAAFAVTRCRTEGHTLDSPVGDALLNALRTPDSYLALLPREVLAPALTHAADAAAYARTVAAMAVLGFTEAERAQVTAVLAAILLLCNVNFTEAEGSTSATNPALVRTVASLLGVADAALFEMNLVSTPRFLNIGEDVMSYSVQQAEEIMSYSVQQAEEMRDNLATNLYVRLFAWLVRRVNTALRAEHKGPLPEAEVCVSDMAGYSGQRDSLTQLLLNHAADRMQLALAAHYFAAPPHEYLPGVLAQIFGDARTVGSAAVDLCSGSSHAVLDILGHESCVWDGSDAQFFQRLCASPVASGSPAFKSADATSRAFSVQHVGGTARYVVTDWLHQTQSNIPYPLKAPVRDSAYLLVSRDMLWERDSLYLGEHLKFSQAVTTRTTAFREELDRALSRTVRQGAPLFTVHCVRRELV